MTPVPLIQVAKSSELLKVAQEKKAAPATQKANEEYLKNVRRRSIVTSPYILILLQITGRHTFDSKKVYCRGARGIWH